jgi:hypothetical protein
LQFALAKNARSDNAPQEGEKFSLELFETKTLCNNRDSAEEETEISHDYLAYTGGTVKCLDWAPLAGAGLERRNFLAVGAYRSPSQRHVIGRVYEGPNVLQIWSVDPEAENPAEQMKMEVGLAHPFDCALAVQWCPASYSPDPDPQKPDRLGILAAAFADGKVRVYSVPHPDYIKKSAGM